MYRLALTCLAVLLLGAGSAGGGEKVMVDGVLHIQNGKTPSNGVETLTLKELWRAGGEDDETFFGLILQALVDDEGNIYLLDSQLNEVLVYSPDGQHIKSLGREGDGPGEMRGPADMLFLPDGTLGILQAMPGKIIKLDLGGTPAGSLDPRRGDATQGGISLCTNAAGKGDYLVISGMTIAPGATGQDRTSYIATFDGEGLEKARLLEVTQTWDFTGKFHLSEKSQFFPHGRYTALAEDGRVYTVPHRNQYLIHVYTQDGTLERVIQREYTSHQRDEDELGVMAAAMEGAAAQFPFEIETSYEQTDPDLTRLMIAPDGSLWVLSSQGQRPAQEGVLAVFDVFDTEGHFTKQVAVECEGDGTQDFLMFAGSNRVVLVTGLFSAALAANGLGAGDEDENAEPMKIICYEY